MKTKFFRHTIQLLTLLALSSTLLNAQQLKLGTNPSVIQKSALLELESNSQGVLLPRITDTTLATIKTAPDGMIIFLTLNNSLCIRANGQWHKLIPEGEALTSMNGSTVPVQTITATNNGAPVSLTTVGGNHFLNLPDATASYSGFVGTGIQTFSGAKTFNDNLTANQDLLLPNIIVDNTKDSVLLIDAGKVWKKRLTGLPPTGAASGDLSGTYPSPVIAAGAVTGAKMAQAGATTGQVLKWNGTTWAPAADNNTGTLTSVGLTAPSLFTVTNSPLTANGSIALGLQTQTANTIFAGPGTGAAATPTFRALLAADIPALPFSNITGVVPVAQGGTNLTTAGAAGTVLTSNGTVLSYSTLGGDVTGTIAVNIIAAKAVTYAKIQDVTTQKILGRYTAGSGSVQEVSLDNSLKLNTAGTLYADSSLAIWNASKLLGRTLSPLAPASGQVLKYNGTTWAPAADDNTGSLTSVGFTAPSLFTVTNSPLTANGAIALGLQTQTANTIFAGPGTGAAATPTFRALLAADIPALPFSNITGVVPVAQGGTNLTTAGAAGTVLTSNGTVLSYSALGGDVTGTIAANTIGAGAVTYGKIQNVNTQKILGRYTAGTGSVQEVSLDNSLKLTTAGTLYADSSLAIWNASKLLGRTLSPLAPATGQVLKYNGTTWEPAADDNSVGLSSVGLTMPAIFTVTGSPLTANGTIATTLQTQTANTIFAGPGTGAAATPTFRTLTVADITGVLPIAKGGTGLTAVGAAGTVLTSNGTSLTYAAPAAGLTSVGLTMPSIFAVANSPLTANGTIAATLQTQTANTFFAGPGTGAAATPVFRSMATADIPDQGVTYAKIQNVTTQKLLGRYTAGTGTVQEITLDNSLKLNTAGTLYADSSLAIWNASELQGRRVSAVAPTDNYILKWDAASSTWGPEVETSATNWTFVGNSNTTATSFLGTTVDQPMVLKYNNNELFRGTKGVGLYASKTVALFNGATPYNGHPVIIRANGPDVLAFQDSTGVIKWHWNMLGTGLNFVESNVADYRLFLQNGGNVGINTSTPSATLDVEGTVQFGVAGSVLTNIIKVTGTTTAAASVTQTTPVNVTFAIPGAVNTSTIIVNPQAAFTGGLGIGAVYVTTAGTVIVRLINTSGTTVNYTTGKVFNITIIN